jgi:HPt (histidine-containing phosphotransfer) domain-containing protein
MSDRAADFDMPYDEAEFLERVEEDLELGDEIIRLFLDTCPKALADLQETLAQGDLDTLARLAHGIKGSTGVFGARACFAAAMTLEAAARAGDLGAARQAWVRLRREVQRLSAALEEKVGGKTSCDC